MTTASAPGRVPAGATPEGDGIIAGNGPVRVDAYIDLLCPFRRQFELSSVSGTPTVRVAGEDVQPEGDAITAAVARAAGQR